MKKPVITRQKLIDGCVIQNRKLTGVQLPVHIQWVEINDPDQGPDDFASFEVRVKIKGRSYRIGYTDHSLDLVKIHKHAPNSDIAKFMRWLADIHDGWADLILDQLYKEIEDQD